MITKIKLISDVILQLTQGSPSDDLQLEELQVAQWATYSLNQLVKSEVSQAIKSGSAIPPIYLQRVVAQSLIEDPVSGIADANQRMYVALTEDVLDLPNDAGIVQVEDYDGNLIYKTSMERSNMLRDLRFAKPSQENRVYYREFTKIYIEGFTYADIEFNDIIVTYIPKQDIESYADDDTLLITDQLIPLLVDMCVQRGKLELYGSQADAGNDGTDAKQTQYHTAISNPTKGDQQQTEQ